MKQSAGLLLYRTRHELEVLLVHPGGPFWAKKDAAAWSIPKGEFVEGDPLDAAKREFEEELGQPAPPGEYRPLGSIKNKSGKVVYAWAVEADVDVRDVKSNTFTLEWPPKSGQQQDFPEVDKAAWFNPETAIRKLNGFQPAFVERLTESLGIPLQKPEQTTLL